MLEVHPSGFYAWLKQPHSIRYKNDQRQTGLIKLSIPVKGAICNCFKIATNNYLTEPIIH